MTASNASESCRFPALVTRARTRHRRSASRWILLVSPPREWPSPSRSGAWALPDRLPAGVAFGAATGAGGTGQGCRCQPLGWDVLGRCMAGSGGVVVGADHGGIDGRGPVRCFVLIASDPQAVQDLLPGSIP